MATGREKFVERIGRVLLNLFERATLLLVDPQELLTQMRIETVARNLGAILGNRGVDDLEALAQVHEQWRIGPGEPRRGESREVVDGPRVLLF